MMPLPIVTRFAPSPSGHLHLGHAYSALFSARAAASGGRFLLRIEDIDLGRCRPEFADAIADDLSWLGLAWEEPVRHQSRHLADYQAALDTLSAKGLLYPCFCTRADIRREIDNAGRAPHPVGDGPDGPLYPGTCRGLDHQMAADRRRAGEPFALRLDMAKALEVQAATGSDLVWQDVDTGTATATPAIFGDAILARKDIPTSYHLSVVVDDHLQGITLVTRGEDLRAATHLHRLLQFLLDLETPAYRFHKLLTDQSGRRYAKRDKPSTIRGLRKAGKSAAEVIAMTGWES